VNKERLGYPVCSGWFEEFGIWAKDWLNGNCSLTGRADEDGNYVQSEDFVMEPMCNYHHHSGVYLSRKYWVAMVEMFGYSLQKGIVLNDPDTVEPELVTCFLNTRSIHDGSFSDIDTIESICEAKGIVIGTSE